MSDPNFYKYQYLLNDDFKFKILNSRYKEWIFKNGFNINNYKADRIINKLQNKTVSKKKSKKKI